MKELKDSRLQARMAFYRDRRRWNPVKELKDSPQGSVVARVLMWNPVKELKGPWALPRVQVHDLRIHHVESGEGIESRNQISQPSKSQ